MRVDSGNVGEIARGRAARWRYEWHVPGLAIVAWFLVLLLSFPGKADEPADAEVSRAAQESLAKGSRFPWYDRRQDDVRRLHVVPRAAPLERDDAWADKGLSRPQRKWSRFSLLGPFLQWFGLTALMLLLGLIAFMIARSFLRDEASEDALAARRVIESRRDADRVEALPFRLRVATGDFLAEARRELAAGRFSEAIIYLFSYELVELDKHHVIRLAKGKTNRQYVREMRHRPHLAAILEITMTAFEDAFFGRKTLSREAFERAWQRLEEFQGQLAQEERAAA